MKRFLSVFALCTLLLPVISAAQPSYDEIIVNFIDQAGQKLIEEIESEYQLDLDYNSIFSEEEALLRFSTAGKSAEELQRLMQRLTDEEDIEYAEPNYLYRLAGFPNDPLYAEQWNMTMLDMQEAWEIADGKGAVVAVIDTGVAFETYKDKQGTYHRVQDLAQTAFVAGYDFIDDDEHANDDHGHGTHVAGTIAQSTNNNVGVAGIAYQSSIMPLKVLSRYGSGNIADIAEAIVFAADHGAHVINMSLGGGGDSLLMREAIEYAHKKGVTIICAAGNENRNRASYPAAYPYAVGVSSVGPDGELAPYSNYGKGIDIAAPGGNTKTKREHGILQNTIGRMDPTKDGFEYFQGTSMASPHVAGVAALLVSLGVKEPAQIEKILFSSATEKHDNAKYGAGLLNAAAAVQAATSGAQSIARSPFQFKESMIYFMAGIGFALVYFKLLKRSDGYGKLFSFLFSLAMFLSSSGIFVLEYLPLSFLPQGVVHALSSPIPNLDRLFWGDVASINPVLHSVLLPLVLIIALLSARHWKWFAIGIAVGMSSHFFVDVFFSSANVMFIPGTFLLDKAWLLLNGAFCFGLAVLAGKSE